MKLVFIVQAHQGEMPNTQLSDVCTVELMCETGEEALKRAKKLINKKHYRISHIIEKDK